MFIVDFTFTAILLIPQLLAWTYEDPERAGKRALILWAIFTPTPLLIARIGVAVGAPISGSAVLVAMVFFALLFFLPAALGWGLRIRYENWNRVGLALAIAYVLAATVAHHAAFERVRQFAAQEKLEVQTIGALPLPPSLWHWDGLVRAPRGVYEVRMDLSDDLLKKNEPWTSRSSRAPIIRTPLRTNTSKWRGNFLMYRRSYGLLDSRSRVSTKKGETLSWNFPICGFRRFDATALRRSPIRCDFPPMEKSSAKAGFAGEFGVRELASALQG